MRFEVGREDFGDWPRVLPVHGDLFEGIDPSEPNINFVAAELIDCLCEAVDDLAFSSRDQLSKSDGEGEQHEGSTNRLHQSRTNGVARLLEGVLSRHTVLDLQLVEPTWFRDDPLGEDQDTERQHPDDEDKKRDSPGAEPDPRSRNEDAPASALSRRDVLSAEARLGQPGRRVALLGFGVSH
jgi:hypothetical protein